MPVGWILVEPAAGRPRNAGRRPALPAMPASRSDPCREQGPTTPCPHGWIPGRAGRWPASRIPASGRHCAGTAGSDPCRGQGSDHACAVDLGPAYPWHALHVLPPPANKGRPRAALSAWQRRQDVSASCTFMLCMTHRVPTTMMPITTMVKAAALTFQRLSDERSRCRKNTRWTSICSTAVTAITTPLTVRESRPTSPSRTG